jgi:hypothetical protein
MVSEVEGKRRDPSSVSQCLHKAKRVTAGPVSTECSHSHFLTNTWDTVIRQGQRGKGPTDFQSLDLLAVV